MALSTFGIEKDGVFDILSHYFVIIHSFGVAEKLKF